MKRLVVGLAPLVVIAALAVVPVAAQAVTQPHWYVNSKILTKPKTVKTEAGLAIGPYLFIPGTPPVTVSCKFRDAETLENPASGGAGVDEMKVFAAISCGPNPCPVNSAGVQAKLKVKALGLPWKTELVEVPPIADEIKGIKLEFACKKTTLAVLSGTLSPWVNVNQLEFTPSTGTLGGAQVVGFDNFLPPNVVEAMNP
jgi:hypothetical protein